jgi:hypothetical protein
MTHLTSSHSKAKANGDAPSGQPLDPADNNTTKGDEEQEEQDCDTNIEDSTRKDSGDGGESPTTKISQKSELLKGMDVRARKFAEASYEEASLWDAFSTYLCYAMLVICGYVNDIIRPRTTLEKNREVNVEALLVFFILNITLIEFIILGLRITLRFL